MKIAELVEAQQKKPKKPKARPKKNLWFAEKQWWLNDLVHERGEVKLMRGSNFVVAIDQEEKFAFGIWKDDEQKGITFFKPRNIHVVVPPRASLEEIRTEEL